MTRCLRLVPSSVWAVTALFTLTLVGWSLLAPMGRAADESVHVDLVLHVADEAGDQSARTRSSFS